MKRSPGSRRSRKTKGGSALPKSDPVRNPASSIPAQAIIDARDGSDGKGVVAISAEYSGPLPTPKDFAAYGEVLEDAPERILAMAEKSVDAQNDALTAYAKSNLVSQHYIGIATLILFVGSLITIGILFWQGNPYIALFPLTLLIVLRFLKPIRDIFQSDGS